MEIICGKLNGFCAGVNYTVNKALENLETTNETIYCLGEIIHNEKVIEKLENKGMITVETLDEVPNDSKVIFRAHGEPKEVYEQAINRNIEIIDLTCGKIRVIRNKIDKEKEDSFIIIIGKKNHPETIGNLSFVEKGCIIENIEDVLEEYNKYKETNIKKIFIIAQTTFSSSKFDDLVENIKTTFTNSEIIIDKTICDATEKRQQEAAELSKIVDKMIIIGGKHSSNTKELYKIAEKYCDSSILIQTSDDLKSIKFNKEDKIGVISGASTAPDTINEVVKYLNNKE